MVVVNAVAALTVAVCWLPSSTEAASAIGKRCGAQVCELLDYCSPLHERCEPCRLVCDATSGHYDRQICNVNCESYILEQHLLNAANGALGEDVKRLQRQQSLMLVGLVILTAMFLLLNGVRCIRWLRRHDRLSFKWLKRLRPGQKSTSPTPRPAEQMTHVNPHTHSPKVQSRGIAAGPQVTAGTTAVLENGAAGLRIHRLVSTGTTDNASTVRTATTPISRHPAEDCTEPFSYDNAGLQVTPTTSKPKSESTF